MEKQNMKIMNSKTRTFLTSYNPYCVTYIMDKGGKKVMTFYQSFDNMPASVRVAYSNMQRNCCR